MSAWRRWAWSLGLIAVASATGALCDPAPASDARQVDLAKPFNTRSPWRLVVTQGPPVEDPGGNQAPGALHLCLEKSPAGPCVSEPLSPAGSAESIENADWGAHYLEVAAPAYPQGQGAAPLLRIVTASMHAGDGGQAVVTQLLKYDRDRDAFERIYAHTVGTNNNEEVRLVADGPLMGDVISAEPTQNSPFGYWIVVSRFTSARTYQQVLRYRSATRYGDGNALAVIDSEMPNIERHLGVWKPGSPLPLPSAKACLRPRLKQMELWCE
jgi:hypothetical protein